MNKKVQGSSKVQIFRQLYCRKLVKRKPEEEKQLVDPLLVMKGSLLK